MSMYGIPQEELAIHQKEAEDGDLSPAQRKELRKIKELDIIESDFVDRKIAFAILEADLEAEKSKEK